MPTTTYIALANITLGSDDADVTFASIPATYRDLVLVIQTRSSRATSDDDVFIQFNGDTGANYNYLRMVGRTGGVSSAVNINGNNQMDLGEMPADTATAGQFGNTIIQILDYSATDKHKSVLARNNAAGSVGTVGAHSGRWASTNAITSIKVYARVGNLKQNSTFALYGIVS